MVLQDTEAEGKEVVGLLPVASEWIGKCRDCRGPGLASDLMRFPNADRVPKMCSASLFFYSKDFGAVVLLVKRPLERKIEMQIFH